MCSRRCAVYEDGDDQMKKTIGEAMLKSKQGIKDDDLTPDPPDLKKPKGGSKFDRAAFPEKFGRDWDEDVDKL